MYSGDMQPRVPQTGKKSDSPDLSARDGLKIPVMGQREARSDDVLHPAHREDRL